MASSTITFAPHQSSPLARTKSAFKDPRPPPSIPGKTAELWDEYENCAAKNAKRQDTTCGTPPRRSQHSSRFSSGTVLDIIKSYDSSTSPRVPTIAASPTFDFGFSPQHRKNSSTTVAICKTCKQSITSTLGICERCKKTIILPAAPGETTPPLSPAARNFASTDLPHLGKVSSRGATSPTSTSPKREVRHPSSSTQLMDPPIRLSSLRPPPPLQDSPRSSIEAPRPRKASLTDPNEPFLRLQISRKPNPLLPTHTAPPPTPPPTPNPHYSAPHARPSSLANITTPPKNSYSSTRHTSATPSELSTLYPYISSSTTTSPPSLGRASYQLQNTTSAWDDWDSDEEEEKIGLVGYWKGRKWRGSRGSLGMHGGSTNGARRDSAGKEERGSAKTEVGRKRRGFVRVLSCGCSDK